MTGYLKWIPSSPELLEEAETKVLSGLKTPYKGRFINVGPVVGGRDCLIRTIVMNEECTGKIPMVLLHGLGAGVGFWAANLDKLAQMGRPIYAMDHLGFGRSSRPIFSNDPFRAEQQFVNAIEEWRKCLNLEKFILMGHSLGGFLGMSYTLSYPQRVVHLILLDPFGLTGKPKESERPLPLWVKFAAVVSKPFNFLWVIRVAGPLGHTLLRLLQQPMRGKFSSLRSDNEEFRRNLINYGYHCNVQDAEGESAFRSMSDFAWPKLPMNQRIPHQLPTHVDLTVVYGAKSFIWRLTQQQMEQLRNNDNSYTSVQVMEDAGHLLFLDQKAAFDDLVCEACSRADEKEVELVLCTQMSA